MNKVSINYADQSLLVGGIELAKGVISFEREASDRMNRVCVGDIRCLSLNMEACDDDIIIDLTDYYQSDASSSTAVSTMQRSEHSNFASELIQQYLPLFSDKPGCTSVYEHKIMVMKDKVVVRRSYPVPFALRSAVNEEIKRMLEMGIIERSISQFCNPMRIVKKKMI